jgi:ribosome biogenesis GTPase
VTFVKKEMSVSDLECVNDLLRSRVTIVDRDRYHIHNDQGEFTAQLAGRLMYTSEQASELPCVGDYVCAQCFDEDDPAIIHSVFPRKSFLRRKSAGRNIDYQMIAANIDTAFIVQSCHYDFNIRRLERYLVMVQEGGIEPVVLLTKTDLVSQEELADLIQSIRKSGIQARILTISNVTGDGLSDLKQQMEPGKTYSLIGSSGVGKTTLINQLRGNAELETKTVSATGEGRHTTVRRQLIELPDDIWLVDTPGMRELGVMVSDQAIEQSFEDVAALAKQCRFADCTHTNEPGCAVLQAIEQGELDRAHFESYLKLKKESEFNQMSYVEKRQKDRAFGKYVASVVRHKNKN